MGSVKLLKMQRHKELTRASSSSAAPGSCPAPACPVCQQQVSGEAGRAARVPALGRARAVGTDAPSQVTPPEPPPWTLPGPVGSHPCSKPPGSPLQPAPLPQNPPGDGVVPIPASPGGPGPLLCDGGALVELGGGRSWCCSTIAWVLGRGGRARADLGTFATSPGVVTQGTGGVWGQQAGAQPVPMPSLTVPIPVPTHPALRG